MRLYLDTTDSTGALHPGRHVHGVAPDIVMGLPGPDDTSGHRAVIDAHLQDEVVEALLVDARQGFLQLQCELDQGAEVAPSRRVLRLLGLCYP